MGGLGCKGGAVRKPLEATARSGGGGKGGGGRGTQVFHLYIKGPLLTEEPK